MFELTFGFKVSYIITFDPFKVIELKIFLLSDRYISLMQADRGTLVKKKKRKNL